MSNQQQFASRYEMLCGCGQKIDVKHAGPRTTKDNIMLRRVCPCCKNPAYAIIAGADAYKMRRATQHLQMAILDVFAEIDPPMTVRQVYYRLTTKGAVPKTESGYNKVQLQLTAMRRCGSIPYGWIGDNSRSFYQVKQHNGLDTALDEMQKYYRKDLWLSQDAHVEIWLEKRALIGQLSPVCNEFGVRLYPCGGYSSISFAFEAATELKNIDRPIYIYHLSDWDADGVFSSVSLENELREHGAEFQFRRLAVDIADVVDYGLEDALRPQKKSSPRYNWWKDLYGADMQNCELDALHPNDLRNIVHNAIVSHIDVDEWNRVRRIEKTERDTLATISASFAAN